MTLTQLQSSAAAEGLGHRVTQAVAPDSPIDGTTITTDVCRDPSLIFSTWTARLSKLPLDDQSLATYVHQAEMLLTSQGFRSPAELIADKLWRWTNSKTDQAVSLKAQARGEWMLVVVESACTKPE